MINRKVILYVHADASGRELALAAVNRSKAITDIMVKCRRFPDPSATDDYLMAIRIRENLPGINILTCANFWPTTPVPWLNQDSIFNPEMMNYLACTLPLCQAVDFEPYEGNPLNHWRTSDMTPTEKRLAVSAIAPWKNRWQYMLPFAPRSNFYAGPSQTALCGVTEETYFRGNAAKIDGLPSNTLAGIAISDAPVKDNLGRLPFEARWCLTGFADYNLFLFPTGNTDDRMKAILSLPQR